ncbi:MAG TPA: 3-hydroxyacyl-CoA dehydrogenase NAD-binding domain-containing protein [Candidatus Deferrimicrobiaceae bacterium]|nr:3-hydroxyacyl-CoA dehydrogenase NAD-binding domain-containing protein [Candidatus Deferrimicrobiaceae bacterium]
MDRARLAVIGAGTMGAGIAQVALEAGWEVRLHDVTPGAVERARERIRDGLARRAARAVPDPARHDEVVAGQLANLEVAATAPEAAAEAALVIEAVIEDLDAKRALFAELDAVTDAGTILATNTSALSVTKIADGARFAAERVLGLHFFNPAPLLALVEVVAATRTADWAVERAAAFVEGWGKTPIRCADSPGFIVNRVNRPFTLEALRLLHAGVGTVEAIDAAVVEAGFPMGPFALMDLIGLDVNLAAARSLFEAFGRPPRLRPSPVQEELVASGRLGRKTGEGFYRYEAGRRRGPAARFAAAPSRAATDDSGAADETAIADRLILAIVNEAYRALGDGVATASDIDRAMVLGASHPFGPFEWAARTGLDEVALMLDALASEDADTFRPALALLREVRGR